MSSTAADRPVKRRRCSARRAPPPATMPLKPELFRAPRRIHDRPDSHDDPPPRTDVLMRTPAALGTYVCVGTRPFFTSRDAYASARHYKTKACVGPDGPTHALTIDRCPVRLGLD